MKTNQWWEGWDLIVIPETIGGSQARSVVRLKAKRRRQKEVLDIIGQTRPDVLEGQVQLDIAPDEVAAWQKRLEHDDDESVYALRDRINFLARGLEQGQKHLDWTVAVPAPLTIAHRESSPFNPQSFSALSFYRSWHQRAADNIDTPQFLALLEHGNGLKGHRKLDPEYISWGLALFHSIVIDGLLDLKAIQSLTIYTNTLTLNGNRGWIELFGTLPSKMLRVPPRRRWMPSAATIGLILYHIKRHGQSGHDNYKTSAAFAQKAWKQFLAAIKAPAISLREAITDTSVALRLAVPSYLINASMGKLTGTALNEDRWLQLALGGYRPSEPEDDAIEGTDLSNASLSIASRRLQHPPSVSHDILRRLRDQLYKRKTDLRPTFAALSSGIEQSIDESRDAAPIVECICHWIKSLHLKKLKQPTLYTYLNRLGFPLLQSLGNTPVDQEHIDTLRDGYQEIADTATSEKDRRYKLGLIRQFQQFLESRLGLPNVWIGEIQTKESPFQSQADANLISETEYQRIANVLLHQATNLMGTMRYWIFALGYRAGLRISEAVSIQIRDIQLTSLNDSANELFLFVRPNRYVDTKSFDARRALPLHLLLTYTERQNFERFVREREVLTPSSSAMLFSDHVQSTRPIPDTEVYPAIHEAMRAVTGDQRLRYHHLRHSLANHLLLLFHDIEPPYSMPSHLGALKRSLSEHYTKKALYFIAQLLGHASPETTLRSYLHCQDQLLQHFLHGDHSRDQKTFPFKSITEEQQLKRILPILEIKEATFRQWKARYGSAPVQWMGHKFKGVMAFNPDVIGLQPFPEQGEIEVDPKRPLISLSLAEFELVMVSAQQGWNPEQIEHVFRLKARAYEAIERAYVRIVMVATRAPKKNTSAPTSFRHLRPHLYSEDRKKGWSGRYATHIITMPPPRSPAEQDVAMTVFAQVMAQLRNFQLKEGTLKCLRFFYKYHRASENHIWIKDAEAGIEFIRWLISLKSTHSSLTLKIQPSEISPISSTEQIETWQTLLGAASKKLKISKNKTSRRFKKCLGTGHLSFEASKVTNITGGAYGLRYALIMVCTLGYADLSNDGM